MTPSRRIEMTVCGSGMSRGEEEEAIIVFEGSIEVVVVIVMEIIIELFVVVLTVSLAPSR